MLLSDEQKEYIKKTKRKNKIILFFQIMIFIMLILKNSKECLIEDKTNGLMTQDYYFCNNCLQTNRALIGKNDGQVCPVCGSKDLIYNKKFLF